MNVQLGPSEWYLMEKVIVLQSLVLICRRVLERMWWYLAGVSMTAKIPYGSFDSFSKIGRAKAAVLPLPVRARPITSFPEVKTQQFDSYEIARQRNIPARICETQRLWISVGL